MAIHQSLVLKVSGKTAKISKPVYLYMGDGGVILDIEIQNKDFKIGAMDSSTNMVTENSTETAKMCILKPSGEITYRHSCTIHKGVVRVNIDKSWIDELAEVGEFAIQIHLYDEDGNRITVPPFKFEVLKPLCDLEAGEDTP